MPLGSGINHLIFWIECPTVRNVPVIFRMFFQLCWFTLCHWEMFLRIPLFVSDVSLCTMYRWHFVRLLNFMLIRRATGICCCCFGFPWVALFFLLWGALTYLSCLDFAGALVVGAGVVTKVHSSKQSSWHQNVVVWWMLGIFAEVPLWCEYFWDRENMIKHAQTCASYKWVV